MAQDRAAAGAVHIPWPRPSWEVLDRTLLGKRMTGSEQPGVVLRRPPLGVSCLDPWVPSKLFNVCEV